MNIYTTGLSRNGKLAAFRHPWYSHEPVYTRAHCITCTSKKKEHYSVLYVRLKTNGISICLKVPKARIHPGTIDICRTLTEGISEKSSHNDFFPRSPCKAHVRIYTIHGGIWAYVYADALHRLSHYVTPSQRSVALIQKGVRQTICD